MKALSIRQPYAWLIAKGIKGVENRSWETKYRGRVYIHAGAKFDKDALHNWRLKSKDNGGLITLEQGIAIMYLSMLWTQGAIIGEADIVDCKFLFGEENDNLYSPWHETGMYGFILANPVSYETPIPCKGQLGLFNVELPEAVTEFSASFRSR